MSVSITSPTNNINSKSNIWNNSGINSNAKNSKSSIASDISRRISDQNKAKTSALEEKNRSLLRSLNSAKVDESTKPYGEILRTKTYTDTLSSKKNGYINQIASSKVSDATKDLPKYKYNYKSVSNKIISAKTSVSAGQAVIAAKRKVIEVRRKLQANSKDSDELQLALIHAERMEMVARKKKHNLEQEELVEDTMSRDESMKRREESTANYEANPVFRAEDEIQDREDEIFDARYRLLEDAAGEIADLSQDDLSNELMDSLSDMIASFGEDELRELDEAMQLMESMEIIDPHMSEEDLDKLKTKHRNDEYKAIMKANLDYIKAYLKLTADSMNKSSPAASSASMGVSAYPASFTVAAYSGSADASVSSAETGLDLAL